MTARFSKEWVFGLVGTGGFARGVMPMVLDLLSKSLSSSDIQIMYVETSPRSPQVNGIPVISEEEFFAIESNRKLFNVAIADSHIRMDIADKWLSRGVEPITLRSRSSQVVGPCDIAAGAILCANTIITANVSIGKFFHANIYSYVEHDCVIGDFVTFAPNVHCNGNIRVSDHAYLGAGAILKQGTAKKPLTVGEGATVGMGSVVTKSVAPHTTVVGNPARPLARN